MFVAAQIKRDFRKYSFGQLINYNILINLHTSRLKYCDSIIESVLKEQQETSAQSQIHKNV